MTISSRVVSLVNPKMAPRASMFQWGAPSPTKAGTMTTLLSLATDFAISSESALTAKNFR